MDIHQPEPSTAELGWLPRGETIEGSQWLELPLPAELLSSLRACLTLLEGNADALLAAALQLVQSRLDGRDEVTIALPAAQRPCSGGDSRRGTAGHLLQQCLQPSMQVASTLWAIGDQQTPWPVGVASVWRLRLDGPAELRVGFSAPLHRAAIDALARCLQHTLQWLVSAQQAPLADFDLLDAGQRLRLIRWNATAQRRDPGDSVGALFAAVAARQPQAIAVCCGSQQLSYAALERRALQLAHGLRHSGITAGMPVALLMERSIDAVVAMLGILRAGAAYLPLDPALPVERLAFMLEDAGASLLLHEDGQPVPAGLAVASCPLSELSSAPADDDLPAPDQQSLAYLMYTSGSTGKPKGVQIAHRGIIRLVQQVDYVTLAPTTRLLHAAPLGFDAATFEVWGALLNGGTCVIHPQRVPTAQGLADTIERHGVQLAWLTAALFNSIVDQQPQALAGLRQLIIGGEALSLPHVRKAYDALPLLTLVNGYGPTECTTFTTTWTIPRELPAGLGSLPIGRPIADTTLQVLNPRGEPLPPGLVGELYVGGRGVALGYLGRPELDAERFIVDRHDPCGGRLYRTGDLARWRDDGALEFIGRADQQVKIRGHRIEPGEVEAALQQLPGVRACAVLAREDSPGQRRLVAYVVGHAGQPTSPRQLQQQLATRLPDYMLPSAYVPMPALPLTANGKLDRRALPAPGRARPELAGPYLPPRNALERQLCALFAQQLQLDEVGRDDHFFELGGHSLLAVQTLAQIHQQLSPLPSITDFFAGPSVAALAELIEQGPRHVPTGRPNPPKASSSDPVAIIAMSGRFPGAGDVETFWDNLCAGRESIRFFGADELDPSIPPEQRDDPAYVAARGVIDGVEDFDAAFFGMTPREAELTDPQHRLFLELCWECLERAGYVPDQHDAPVGVFAGMHNATYFQRHLAGRSELIDKLGAFQVMLANEKDYLTTRAAHKLNLTGPAISLNTACSTSLVAIVQAVEALRAGQCEMALAGGVSISCPPRSGYLSQEGSMLSPDGHTRSFDRAAQGTVFSDGAALLLLKRLGDAQRDGDPIYAVIRGGAVNNDGAHKASFTAPSSAGQATVIRTAMERAGVGANSITYVETHGTATPLGDPIEIEGLRQAFAGVAQPGHCAIGSLKSNVGHLVMAAGAAGVIKTALSLCESTLPPTLHFQSSHPQLGLEPSPFVVNACLRAWPAGEGPRRAGVSSFGVGGTNAHVILEEAPARDASEPARGASLLRLSARSPSALSAAAERLAGWLDGHPQANLADVAWTLEVGRKNFEHRLAVAADNVPQAAERLRTAAAGGLRSVLPSPPAIAMMFPGQGAQYAGMGRQLYHHEAAFREAMDDCAQALREQLGFDLRARLFDGEAQALRATALTQPAMFALEYALAKLWMAHGLQPQALIGHSVGEFVAAVLAGVMSLDDGAWLVARRGQLMQAMPAGAMLSVRLAAAALASRLPAGLSLAADNAPQASVAAGPCEAIESLRRQLEGEGIACRLLQTSHAFHSAMMEPAREAFAAEVAKVRLHAPRLPIVSTASGHWLSVEQATSADYWASHLRDCVRFSPALQCLLVADHALLEVGPRTGLGALARQHPQARGRLLLASLGDSADGEHAAWREALGQGWALGLPVRSHGLDARQRRRRLCLPSYPFERKRHWIEACLPSAAQPTPSTPAAVPFTTCPEPPMAVHSTAAAPSAPLRAQRLIGELTALFEDVTGQTFEAVDPATHFIELGLDSLSLTQVALQLQKAYALKISFRELMEACASFERLAQHIDRLLPQEVATAADHLPAVAPSTPLPAPPAAVIADGGMVQSLIQQQMAIMQQQLALLGMTAGSPTPAIATAPVAAAAGSSVAAPAAGADAEVAALAHTRYDVKKAFGAIARIHSGGAELSARQQARLDAFIRRYTERTAASKAYTSQYRAQLADPRVVNGFRPLLKEIVYQIVIQRSKGARVWDLDGNEYVDALNGFGMNLFGWQPEFVLEAVRRQLDEGYEIGPQHPLAGPVARQVCELTGFDRAALCNTGSEAVMGCVRVARTVTGRDTLVIFSGAYHGIFDEVIVRGTKSLRSVPAAPGILRNTAQHVLVLDYGTAESLAIIRERAQEIAAVLVEPVQSRRPDFRPVEFLTELRAITEQAGSLLIFDEVVTGFRAHPRGAQAVLGIDADLASYGKVVGGGFPIGVIAGKRRYMDALDGGHWQFGDDSVPTVGVTYFAGTFVRHPLALAAADAVLKHLKAAGPALQAALNARVEAFADELNMFSGSVGAPLKVVQFASVWKVNFLEDHPLQDLLFAMMRSRGIHILDNFPCFFTTAHGEADFTAIAKAFKESVLELQEADFLPRLQHLDGRHLDASAPPVTGARLGKDAQGNPAWFVPNPEAPGKYMRVSA